MASATPSGTVVAPPSVVTVFGAGSFGTAMAVVAARRGHQVRILARDPAQVAAINAAHRNPKRLSDFVLPDNITATTDPVEALRATALMIHAIPVQKSPDFLGAQPRRTAVLSPARSGR